MEDKAPLQFDLDDSTTKEDKGLQPFELDESEVEFNSKTSSGCANRVLVCFLLIGAVVLVVFAAAIAAFGAAYYQLVISDELATIEGRVAQLEMVNGNLTEQVSSLQADISTPQAMSQISSAATAAQSIQQQLSTARETSRSSIVGLFEPIRMNLSAVTNAGQSSIRSQLDGTLVQYSESFELIESNLQNITMQRNAQFVSDTQMIRNMIPQTIMNFYTGLLSLFGGGIRSTYNRWGRDSCPDVTGTTLVYSGYMGGSRFNAQGGGHNHVCMPMDPEVDSVRTEVGVQASSRIYGAEYVPLGLLDENVPCAVCAVTIGAEVIMIPAKNSCPSDWTMEYDGYLMTENHGNFRSSYACIDRSPGSVPGFSGHALAADLFLCRADCDSLFCPPYMDTEVMGCVVCSK